MSLALLPVQDQITTYVKELAQDVYENGVPEDNELVYSTDGMMMPFIVVQYSGFIQRSTERGITGPRQDLGRSYADFMCVAPTERAARQIFDLVSDKMTGFEPTGASLLTPEGVGKSYTVSDASTRPVKYVIDLSFSYAVNTVVS